MGKIKKQLGSEIRQLPFTLAKLIGGLMAVIGFPGVIIVFTRKPHPVFSDISPYLAMGICGVVVFVLSSRFAEKRMNKDKESEPTAREKRRLSIIAWTIFVILIVIFVSITFMIT